MFAGIERFLVEILRAKDDRLLGPFTLAQLTSVILVGGRALHPQRLAATTRARHPGAYLTGGKEPVSVKELDSLHKSLHSNGVTRRVENRMNRLTDPRPQAQFGACA